MDDHLTHMEKITRSACADLAWELVEFKGEDSYAHLPGKFLTKAAVTEPVDSFKRVSSRRRRLGENSPARLCAIPQSTVIESSCPRR